MIGRIFRVVRTPVTLLVLFGVSLYGAQGAYQTSLGLFRHRRPSQSTGEVPKGQLRQSGRDHVYNGGDRKGLAADVGRSLRNEGFRSHSDHQHRGEDSKTVIVGADANNPEVLFVKSFFKEATASDDQRVDRTVDVLVGNKYGGFNKDAAGHVPR